MSVEVPLELRASVISAAKLDTGALLTPPRLAWGLTCKPCHDFLYISGAFRRLYPVGTNAKSMSCGAENARRAGRLNG